MDGLELEQGIWSSSLCYIFVCFMMSGFDTSHIDLQNFGSWIF